MKNKFCREGESVWVAQGDNIIFPGIDSCTAMVFVLNNGGVAGAHHVITEKGQEFTEAAPIANAKRLLREVESDIGMMGKKVKITQAIFIGNTLDWGMVNWEDEMGRLRDTYECSTTLLTLPENGVDIYIFSSLAMIEVHKKDKVSKVSFATCINKLNLNLADA